MNARFLKLLLVLAMGVVHWPGIAWWWASVSTGEGRWQGAFAIALAAAAGLRAWRTRESAVLWTGVLPLALMGLSLVFAWWTRPLQLGVVSAGAAWFGVLGLVGVLGGRQAWLHALPALALLALTVPQMAHLEALLGFPLRVGTARGVAAVLSALGRSAVDVGTVLEVEGQTTRIDLPCSGVRSLWTGGAFFFAISWLEQRQFGVRWLGVGLFLGLALAVLNAARVLSLVALATSGWPMAAVATQVIHEPLGIFAFLLAGGGAWYGLQRVRTWPQTAVLAPAAAHGRLWLVLVLAGLLLVARRPMRDQTVGELPLPEGMTAVMVTHAERNVVALDGGSVQKAHFANGQLPYAMDLSGDVVMVLSTGFRSHHAPDICLRAAGATTGPVVPTELGGRPLRRARMSRGVQAGEVFWWIQTPLQASNDPAARLWASIWDPSPAIMVSVLVMDGPDGPLQDADILPILDALYAHAAEILAAEAP